MRILCFCCVRYIFCVVLSIIFPVNLSYVLVCRSYKVDFVLLAGYLKLIPAELIKAYSKAILNIHPSLLPAFGGKGYYGMKVHKAVIASGARYETPIPFLLSFSLLTISSSILFSECNMRMDVRILLEIFAMLRYELFSGKHP